MNVNLETLLLLVFKTMLNIYVGFRLIHTYNHRGAKRHGNVRVAAAERWWLANLKEENCREEALIHDPAHSH
jgi:hypothetical protein